MQRTLGGAAPRARFGDPELAFAFVAIRLALALYAGGHAEGAIQHLLEIVKRKRDWNEDAARKELLKIFEALGPTSELTLKGRRGLSAILFS